MALAASSFDFSQVPPVVVHIRKGVGSWAIPGHIYLDADLLDAGRFSWGTVLHEFGHEIDFLLLDTSAREQFRQALGAAVWWQADDGTLQHDALGGERFASVFAWAYWPSRDNSARPLSRRDEAAAMPASGFRLMLAEALPGAYASQEG